MNISFLVPELNFGGAERTVVYLSSYFVDHGNNVSIVNLSGDKEYNLNSKVNIFNLYIKNNKNILSRCIAFFKRFISLFIHYKKIRPDVIVSLLPETAKYILFLCKIYKIKLITSERNNPELDGNIKVKNKIFDRSDGIIFQTKRAQDYYGNEIKKKSIIIPNAIGNKLVYNVSPSKTKKNKIVAIGRLTKQKDYPTLLKAFRIVINKHDNFNLEIYGAGIEEEELKKLVKRLNLHNNVFFRGVSESAIEKIADAKCYVLSSIYEGMPNSLIEAMAIGLPCVSTDCPNGPSELIKNGINGILVPVGDHVLMAEAINKVIEDEKFASRIAKNALEIRNDHSVEYISEKYLDYIKRVCDEKNG